MNPVSINIVDDIALVTIANPPVNALSQAVRADLLSAIENIDENQSIRAVVLICDGGTFIAGADITEFDKPPLQPHLPALIDRLERSTKPWIATLHGNALGGGFEVALGCHYRIADPATRLGFPEVNLGLIPGAGGTVRLPRIVDSVNAVSLVAGGKTINAQLAAEWGLVDQLAEDDLKRTAMAFAQQKANQPLPEPVSKRPPISKLTADDWEAILSSVRKKAHGQIAPARAAEAIRIATEKPTGEAFTAEHDSFTELKNSDQSKALRYIFFAEKSTSKTSNNHSFDSIPIELVGVVGGGTMGAGIVTALLLSNYRVIMIERDDTALKKGKTTVLSYLQNSLERGLIDTSRHARLTGSLSGSIRYDALADADLVIEAVFEDMDIKLDVFSKLDAVTKPGAILATNTSYLDVNHIAASIKNPARLVGLHFFSPAHIMKLLEIIRSNNATDAILSSCFQLAKTLGKVGVVAGVCDGFIGNRVMSAYRRECEYMLEDGAMPQEIDDAMVAFGFPMGIFAMQDLAGLDIAWTMRKRQAATRDPDTRYVAIADQLCEMGRFGRKTGCGWYRYDDTTDTVVEEIILEESALKGIQRKPISAEEIIARILHSMRNEGSKILVEKIAARPEDIDVVMVNGYGFPRWRGGPMFVDKKPNCAAGNQS
ncbi:MAG: 3-hydroxyacyl-CoA dehydrogenase [Gammaproteobacteria bacterium]|nr:3-hydroxyacyl-CoA dehydrogenase [Gammaproteobacteria bacterium]